MEFHQREYFVSRILRGHAKLKIRNDLVLFVRAPTIEENHDAQEYYQEIYEMAFLQGIMTEEEILEMMLEQGIWTDQYESDIKKVEKKIEDLKVDLYNQSFNTKAQRKTRASIRRAESVLIKLLSRKHSYDAMSCHGVANYARYCWLIENCTYKDEKKYDFADISVSALLSIYQDHGLSDKEIRGLAKTDPWRSTWASFKKSGGTLFETSATCYTTEQKNLILWSSMYDSISESPDAPSDEIILDDDMLDGWLIIQRKERELRTKQKAAEDIIGNEKIANSDEVYIVAKSEEDADKINELNDPQAKAIKTARQQALLSEERTKQEHLPDVAMDLQMKRNRAAMEAAKTRR